MIPGTPPLSTRPYKESAGAIYSDLIRAELTDAMASKTSLEQRGQALVASVGLINGVVFGLATLGASQKVPLPPSVPFIVAFAVVALIASASCGARANWPRRYRGVADASLVKITEENYWIASDMVGSRRAAEVRVAMVDEARTQNNAKAWMLAWGIVFQVIGLALLGAALIAMLSQ